MIYDFRITICCLLAGLILLCGSAWGANDFTTDADCVALWSFDSIATAFTEQDVTGYITITSPTITCSTFAAQKADTLVYRDFGANYFSGDFTQQFQLTVTYVLNTPQLPCWAMTNEVDDIKALFDAGNKQYVYLRWYYGGANHNLIFAGYNTGSDTSVNLAASTIYFITVNRDDDAGTNGTGLYTVYICTGAYNGDAGASLVDTLTSNCSAGAQYDWEYLFAIQSYNSNSSFSRISGTIRDWRMEGVITPFAAGAADLTGYNHLDNTGAVVDAVNYKEGTGSFDFEDTESDKAQCVDIDLNATFPLKSDYGAGHQLSICFWMKPESLGSNTIFYKRKAATSETTLIAYITPKLTFSISGDASCLTTASIQAGRWYHVGFTYDDSDQSYRMRVWDDTAGALLEADHTGISLNALTFVSTEFAVGVYAGSSAVNYYDGLIDELVVFDDILTAAEIDKIRGGTYGATSSVNNWWWRRRHE